jgi:hypothetical protein
MVVLLAAAYELAGNWLSCLRLLLSALLLLLLAA